MFTRGEDGGRGVHAVKSGVWAGKVAFARECLKFGLAGELLSDF